MGRVDEAMRRAAESALASGGESVVSDARLGGGSRESRSEAFPAEVTGQRHLRSVKTEAPRGSSILKPLVDQVTKNLSRKVVIDADIDPISREQYRKLATALHAAQAADGLRVVTVASALASEGKSLTAANLALTLSESYQRSVLLIDGDLRRPSLAGVFNLPPGSGLSDGIMTDEQRLTLHSVSPHLTVLTAGQPTADPMAVLASARMRQLVAEARESFDWVVIDTPPIGLLSDASLLADIADGTLLVLKAETTPFDVVQRAVAALGKDRVLGVVLNQARDVRPPGDYASYYQANVAPGA